MVRSSRFWKMVLALGVLAIAGGVIVAVLHRNDGGDGGPSSTWQPTTSLSRPRVSSALSSPSIPRLPPTTNTSRPRRFATCAEACAAGVAPMRRGDLNYDPRLDRNNDGIACESCP